MGSQTKEDPVSRAKRSPPTAKPPVESVRISISDPKSEEEKVRILYGALLKIKRTESGDTPISYAQFAKYISTQTRGIREKYGCSSVSFTIALDEDAVRFTAAADNR
jgi:hypothetical protein